MVAGGWGAPGTRSWSLGQPAPTRVARQGRVADRDGRCLQPPQVAPLLAETAEGRWDARESSVAMSSPMITHLSPRQDAGPSATDTPGHAGEHSTPALARSRTSDLRARASPTGVAPLVGWAGNAGPGQPGPATITPAAPVARGGPAPERAPSAATPRDPPRSSGRGTLHRRRTRAAR